MTTARATAVVISDLDGTLLHRENYSFEEALPQIAALKRRNIPIVLVSSKTRAEMEPIREALGIEDPFIVENGGAVYIPRGTFGESVGERDTSGRYDVVRWGTLYQELIATLDDVRKKTGAPLIGFHDLDAERVASVTGLSLYEARRAKEREFDEPFWLEKDDPRRGEAMAMLVAGGLSVTEGGRFYHLMGDCDKGRAVRELLRLYRTREGTTLSAGLGDAKNDLPFLREVDRPYLVASSSPEATAELEQALPDARTVGPAPEGWVEAVSDFLDWLDQDP